MMRTDLAQVLRLAGAAKPELLSKAQERIFPRMFDSDLTSTEVGQVLDVLAESTQVSPGDLRTDWKAFRKMRSSDELPAGKYPILDGKFYRKKSTPQGTELVELCNFTATIVEEVIIDDGAEQHRSFVCDGETEDGKPLQRIDVSASEFASMNWPTPKWGAKACISAGYGNKD